MRNKKAQGQTQDTYAIIFGVVISIVIALIIFNFITRVGSSNAGFMPAYITDVRNTIEAVSGSQADIAVVYEFIEPLGVSYENDRVSLSRDKAVTAKRVYVPKDISVEVVEGNNATRFLLIAKTGKTVKLASVGYIDEDLPKDKVSVSDIIVECDPTKTPVEIKTNVAELRSLLQSYAPSPDTLTVRVENNAYGQTSEKAIVYYDPNKTPAGALCRLKHGLNRKLDVPAVLVPTTHPELLQDAIVFISFPSFNSVESKFRLVIEEMQGGDVV